MNRKIDSIEDILEISNIDPRHYTGEIIGSMTTSVHPKVYDIILKFIEKNHNDPYLFPSISVIEKELVERTRRLLRIPHHLEGVLTSGGTESNILAIYSAKKTFGSKTVISMESAHQSIDKAVSLLDMNKVTVSVDDDGYYKMEDLIVKMARNPNSILVLTMGTTEIGRVDSIEEIAEYAKKYNIHIHVDGALGGFTYPFTHPSKFDAFLNLMGDCVVSFSTDYHKFLGAPSPSSVLFLNPEMENAAKWKSSYMPSGFQSGLLGTRPGYMSAAALGTLILREKELPDSARKSLSLAYWVKEELEKSGYQFKIPSPDVPVLCIGLNDADLSKRAWDFLWRNSIKTYFCSRPFGLRLVFMPHVKRKHVKRFIESLLVFLREISISF